MKTFVSFFLLIILISLIFPNQSYAIYDPLSTPNNRYGIHILDPSEITKATKLVNSNGGEWGYVTIPIRADDRDRQKWINFFQTAKQKKIIPILRLATFGRGDTWILPTQDEMLDFANFLNQLPWPIQNRYLIIFNEINHSLEWGGFVDPEAYAEILSYSIRIFKQKNSDFFILPAAMDMAAPNNHTSLNGLTYWKRVFASKPDLVQQIDGWNSHAYPNPGFKGKPTDTHNKSIVSYRYELQLLKKLGRKNIPLFITETGWKQSLIPVDRLEKYYQQAYSKIWTDKNIVAITPFLLQADQGPFTEFAFWSKNNSPNPGYTAMVEIPKTKGKPKISPKTSPPDQLSDQSRQNALQSNFQNTEINISNIIFRIIDFLKQLFNRETFISFTQNHVKSIEKEKNNQPYLQINNQKIKIEIADTPESITLGLGNRQSLPVNRGMLFIFDQPAIRNFWMKKTLFPLDIIWINNYQIIDLTQNIPVEPDPSHPQKLYNSSLPADMVLEVNAGFIKKHQIKTGDQIKLYL